MNPRKTFSLGLAVVLVIVVIWACFGIFENLDAKQTMVIQAPLSGKLTWHTTAGVKWQGFGKVTKYPKREQFWFSMQDDQGKKTDESIPIRFNDGGHGKISGSLAWEMPMDEQHLTALHVRYGSTHAIEQQLVRTVVEKAVYMTGPLMSSQESYASRRNELLNVIDDQIVNGVYKTETQQERIKDAMTGQEKTVSVVKMIKDSKGLPLRQDVSPLDEFKIRVFNLSINKIPYDETVEKQIQSQQQAIMEVQTAMANAKKAEQAAITAEKNGQAEAAKAKWDQEVIKAREVTAAEQRKRVAELDAQAAEQTKRQSILLGEGEAARKRLVMEADGALEPKLKALVEINKFYADAIKGYQGSWVPSVVMGGGSQVAGSGAQQLVDLLTAKTAKELGIDMNVAGTGKTKSQK